MKVTWFCHRDLSHPRAGGAERYTFEVAKRLASSGHAVEVFSTAWKSGPTRACVEGVSFRRFPTYIGPHVAHLVRTIKDATSTFFVDSLAHVVPWGTPMAGTHRGAAFFAHLHANTLRGQVGPAARVMLKGLEDLYPKIYASWPFVTISHSSARDLIALGVQASQISVIPPGVDTALFRPLPRALVPRLVYFSGLREYKRPEHAIAVLEKLQDRGVHSKLIIVGPPSQAERLRPVARPLGESVVFLGWLHEEQLAQVVGESWVHLQCSVSEGWGLTSLEAAAAGVPTAAYAVPGVVDSVQDGETGILVPDGDIDKLTDATERLIRDVASADNWKERCRHYAESMGWLKTADGWQMLIEAR